jgi:hypothetical protein
VWVWVRVWVWVWEWVCDFRPWQVCCFYGYLYSDSRKSNTCERPFEGPNCDTKMCDCRTILFTLSVMHGFIFFTCPLPNISTAAPRVCYFFSPAQVIQCPLPCNSTAAPRGLPRPRCSGGQLELKGDQEAQLRARWNRLAV